MPWTHSNGKFIHYNVPLPSMVATTSKVEVHTVDSVDAGTFVSFSGTTTSFFPNSHLVASPASGSSRLVAGVTPNTSQRLALAWIIPEKRIMSLSGIYDRQTNGIADGKTVILAGEDNSFVMCRTNDDAFLTLKARFDALVS